MLIAYLMDRPCVVKVQFSIFSSNVCANTVRDQLVTSVLDIVKGEDFVCIDHFDILALKRLLVSMTFQSPRTYEDSFRVVTRLDDLFAGVANCIASVRAER
jgi:hypothetical protein